jgi:RNA polymerase sigma factor (sigma-70 family)
MAFKRGQKYVLTPEQSQLVAENIKLAYSFANRKKFPKQLDHEEIESRLFESLCRSAATWQPGQGAAFSTYAFNLFYTVRITMWQEVYHPKNKITVDIDEIYEPAEEVEPEGASKEEKDLLRSLLSHLPILEFQIITRYYAGEPATEIGKAFAITSETVRSRVKLALRRLRIIAARYSGRTNEVPTLCEQI